MRSMVFHFLAPFGQVLFFANGEITEKSSQNPMALFASYMLVLVLNVNLINIVLPWKIEPPG